MQNTQQILAKDKLERINIRITSDIKNTLLYAASLVDMTVNEFLLTSAFDKAKELIQLQETLTLSNEQRDRFFALLETTAKPTKKLKVAMQRYFTSK